MLDLHVDSSFVDFWLQRIDMSSLALFLLIYQKIL